MYCNIQLNHDAHDISYLTHPLSTSINKMILAKCEYVTKGSTPWLFLFMLLNESVVIAVLCFALTWGPVKLQNLHRKHTLYLLDARDALSNSLMLLSLWKRLDLSYISYSLFWFVLIYCAARHKGAIYSMWCGHVKHQILKKKETTTNSLIT